MSADQTEPPGTATGDDLAPVLAAVGARLRALRRHRGATLDDLSADTGISVSTLSRLESGQRRPTLELLLPLARAHQVPLDELVGAPATGDPRIRPRATTRHGMTMLSLSGRPGGPQAYKLIIPVRPPTEDQEQRTHEGYDWLYVLSGRLRLLLGEHDMVLAAGEVAEFDTRTPHWFGSAGPGPAEVLCLFGPQGSACTCEPNHAHPRPQQADPSVRPTRDGPEPDQLLGATRLALVCASR